MTIMVILLVVAYVIAIPSLLTWALVERRWSKFHEEWADRWRREAFGAVGIGHLHDHPDPRAALESERRRA